MEMIPTQSPPDPKAEARRLLDDARKLRDDYEAAFQQFKANSQMNRVLGQIGVEAAYEHFDIPRRVGREALKAFLQKWEITSQYRDFRQLTESLSQRVRDFLGTVSEQLPSLRPPGNSQRLLALLKPVQEAVRLDTRMRRLVAVLEGVETLVLVSNKDTPTPTPRPKSVSTRKGAQTKASRAAMQARQEKQENVALALLGVAVTVGAAATFALFQFLGWWLALVAGIGLALVTLFALSLTRRFWVPAVSGLWRSHRW